MAVKKALYAGTFDPLTNGHFDIIQRSLKIFEHLTILFAIGPSKSPLFLLEQRLEMTKSLFQEVPRVKVDSWQGLVVDYMAQNKLDVIVRGLRPTGDFEYEYQMAAMNRHLNPALETVFLVTGPENSFVSSTLVKEIYLHGGNIKDLVPGPIFEKMKEYRQQGKKS